MNIPTPIPKALPWADGIGPTGRKIDIWKRKCSKNLCLNCNSAQLQNANALSVPTQSIRLDLQNQYALAFRTALLAYA